MLDPRKLKKGWQIQLQRDIKGHWKEYLLNSEGQIVAVEEIDPFKYSKEKLATPNNYEELKKNYQYLSKTEQSPPPISINEPLPPFSLNIEEPEEIDPPNCEPPEEDGIDEEKEPQEEPTDRECELQEPEKDNDPDQEIKENPDSEE